MNPADIFALVTSLLVAALIAAAFIDLARTRTRVERAHAGALESFAKATATSRALATEAEAMRAEIELLMRRPIPGPMTYWCVAGSITEGIQERERRGIHPVNWNFVVTNATNLRGLTLDPAHHTVVLVGSWQTRADLEAVLHEITVASLVPNPDPDPES